MKLSARNQLKGKVININKGAVNSIVSIDIGGGNIIVATISCFIPDVQPESSILKRDYLLNSNGLILSGQTSAALELLCGLMAVHPKGMPILQSHMNTYNGLYALYFNKAHIAAASLSPEILPQLIPGQKRKKRKSLRSSSFANANVDNFSRFSKCRRRMTDSVTQVWEFFISAARLLKMKRGTRYDVRHSFYILSR